VFAYVLIEEEILFFVGSEKLSLVDNIRSDF
jgi:hypothetical protein